MPKTQRQRFFDKQVHMTAWKKQMSGKNEDEIVEVLESLDYQLNTDFVRQHPIAGAIVADFAFIDERVVIEVDGESHNLKAKRKEDDKRDSFLKEHDWIPIRIKDKKLKKNPSFYKALIKEVIDERRKLLEVGEISHINYDIPEFTPEN